MKICIYADQTGQYTEDEIYKCNCVVVDIPEEIIREWYERNIKECVEECIEEGVEPSFENWYKAAYTSDSTDGLYDFAVQRGFTPVCGKKCNGWEWVEE